MIRIIQSICVLMALTFAIHAAEPMSTSTDWRQLYYETNRARWDAKSISELRADAKNGHAVAMYVLAYRLFDSHDRAASKEGESLIDQAAAAGLPQAIRHRAYQIATDDPPSLKRRFEMFERAAATGYPPGQYALAQSLESGQPIRPDPERALTLMRAAADAGLADAKTMLAYMYATGVGEPRGPNDKPLALFTAAAEAGETTALAELSNRYRTGYMVPKNLLRASKIVFCLAAAKYRGFDDTEFRLAPEDTDAAAFNRLLQLFADGVLRGEAKALLTLADMHANGESGEGNPVRAAALYDLATRNGNPAAAPKRDTLVSKLTPDERARYRGELEWMTAIRQRRGDR